MSFFENYIGTGEKKRIKIQVINAEPLEAVLYCGSMQGKTLVVTAGVHGCEYVGIEAARRLEDLLKPEKLKGNVIVLPLINKNGFFYGEKQNIPEDKKNLNREFPGSQTGSLSERMAHAIETIIYPKADFLIDLHGGDCNERLVPLVFFPVAGEEDVNKSALEAAKTLNVKYRVCSTSKNGLYSWAVQKKIPALLIERGESGVWTEKEVSDCLEDIFRIMDYLGILQGDYPLKMQLEILQAIYEEAPFDGFWYPLISREQTILKGEVLGYIETQNREQRVEIRAKMDGVVLYYTTSLGIKKGDSLIAYGCIND